jgi:hypothetical protein
MMISTILQSLTPSQLAALRPFTTFSDADGAVLKEKGLLVENDGVWNHTKLGMQCYGEGIATGVL